MENVRKLASVFSDDGLANTDTEISGFVVLGICILYVEMEYWIK
jgi:hypothetical protein